MTLTIKERVKKAFKELPYTEACQATTCWRQILSHAMRDCDIRRMCVTTSQWAGLYDLELERGTANRAERQAYYQRNLNK